MIIKKYINIYRSTCCKHHAYCIFTSTLCKQVLRPYIWCLGRRVGIRVGVRQLGTPAGCCKSGGRHAEMEGLAELGSNSTAMAQSAHSRTYLFRPNNTHLRLSDKPAMQIYPCPSGRRSKACRDSAGESRGKGLSLWELGQTPGEMLGALLAVLEKQLQKHNA